MKGSIERALYKDEFGNPYGDKKIDEINVSEAQVLLVKNLLADFREIRNRYLFLIQFKINCQV